MNEVIIFFCTRKGAVNKSLLNFTKIREKRWNNDENQINSINEKE